LTEVDVQKFIEKQVSLRGTFAQLFLLAKSNSLSTGLTGVGHIYKQINFEKKHLLSKTRESRVLECLHGQRTRCTQVLWDIKLTEGRQNT
jgi:hypothetical protein